MTKGVNILPIGMEEEARVISFLNANFLRDEPLNISLGVFSEFQPPFAMLKSGLCLKMESENGNLMGIVLNAVDDLPQDKLSSENGNDVCADSSHGPDFWPILRFLNYVDEQVPVKNKEKMMHIHILAVDGAYRNAGIGRRLAEASVQLAREKNIAGILVNCTNHYTSRIFEKMTGFNKVFTCPYASYLDPSGKPVFNPPPPHLAINVFHCPL